VGKLHVSVEQPMLEGHQKIIWCNLSCERESKWGYPIASCKPENRRL